jgi:tetraacyldisaccharide 4'-kinase
LIYRLLMTARNSFYDRQWLRSHRASAFVISVGNLTTGGTGKTPLVISLAQRLFRQGRKVGILSRGYGRKTKGYSVVPSALTSTDTKGLSELYGDEPVEMARALAQVPVVVCEDRVHGAQRMTRDLNVDVILLDDGFQHRRLQRDLDIVVIDTTQPSSQERVLPFGPSRESWSGMSRANIVVLTKCNLGDFEFWKSRVQKFAPQTLLLESQIAVSHLNPLHSVAGHSLDLNGLRGASVSLLSALGNPAAFEKTVEKICGTHVHSHLRLRDHARIDEKIVLGFAQSLIGSEVKALLITQKDAVKIQIPESLKLPVFSVAITSELIGDWSGFDAFVSGRR